MPPSGQCTLPPSFPPQPLTLNSQILHTLSISHRGRSRRTIDARELPISIPNRSVLFISILLSLTSDLSLVVSSDFSDLSYFGECPTIPPYTPLTNP